MTDPVKGDGSTVNPAGQGGDIQVQVRVLGQYIKDISFESPSIHKLMNSQAESPTLNLEMNVHPEMIGPSIYETTLAFKAKAESPSIGVIFELELDYSGLFRIENAPPDVLEAMLHVQCPSILFPFLRRIVADTTRDGGIMPPLMLDPVDFGSLYLRKRQGQADSASA
jgi:preprotein translocase subunit SecB